MDTCTGRFLAAVMLVLTIVNGAFQPSFAETAGDSGFEIKAFEVTGNTLFPTDKLKDAVELFLGPRRTATDVEKARDALEKFYHEAGYPAVLVNIPEQALKDGVVKLQVIESRIGRVRVMGNRYNSREKIMRDLPSFAPGAMLYMPNVQKELSSLNRGRDLKVDPVMSQGKDVGTIDVDLKVEDKLPLHGYLELNNRASHDTKPLRMNGALHYDNLWQKDHSLFLQYQTAPQRTSEVEVLSGSYVLPSPWDREDQWAFYGTWSNSAAAVGEDLKVIGEGKIFGTRYVRSLPEYRLYTHTLSLGLDYKQFDQAVGFTTAEGVTTHTPISYAPLSFSYSSTLPDAWGGTTQFSAGVNMSFRGMGSQERQFELKRYKGRADYVYETASVQRAQKLPGGMDLLVKVDGQSSDQPLIDNEQYVAGGMESVRGYKESEASGDEAAHGTVELSFPALFGQAGTGTWFQTTPFLFYDLATLIVQEPLPGQNRSAKLEGAGAGVRGVLVKSLEYELDWAKALHTTARITSRNQMVYFKLKAVF